MSVAYADDWLTVRHGDVRAELAELPAESVHCVVTSPPYWSLRDYDLPPAVFGGDPEHAHEWGGVIPPLTNPERQDEVRRPADAGQFCECGAWYGDLGLEPTPELYVDHVVEVFRSVRRVLRRDGTLWLNLGDTYTPQSTHRSNGERGGMNQRARTLRDAVPQAAYGKAKDLVGIPWRVAFALQADGWYLRSSIVWSKPNPMPESVTDRPVTAHEYVFLLARSARYYYDAEAVREPGTSSPSDVRKMVEGRERIGGIVKEQTDPKLAASGLTHIGRTRGVGAPDRNLRSVWTIATEPYPGAHFATFPTRLVAPCVRAGTSEGGVCPQCGTPWRRQVEGAGVTAARARNVGGRTDGFTRMPGGEKEWATRSGKVTTGWHPACRHGGQAPHFAVFASPVGEGRGGDYHRARVTGTTRRGLDRSRRDDEGRRAMFRWEQREFARQLRASSNRYAMREEAGAAFEHYTRTDPSGARAVPPELLESWIERGWLTWPIAEDDGRIVAPVPATVLDPFGGSGTTALVAERLGRRAVLVELSEEYIGLALERVAQGRRDGAGAALDMDLPAPEDSIWATA